MEVYDGWGGVGDGDVAACLFIEVEDTSILCVVESCLSLCSVNRVLATLKFNTSTM